LIANGSLRQFEQLATTDLRILAGGAIEPASQAANDAQTKDGLQGHFPDALENGQAS